MYQLKSFIVLIHLDILLKYKIQEALSSMQQLFRYLLKTDPSRVKKNAHNIILSKSTSISL